MSEKRKFRDPGDTEDKVIWNAAGTRKWRMTYTLLEYKPSWRKSKSEPAKTKGASEGAKVAAKKSGKAKPKKANTQKKAKSAAPKKTKAKPKPKTKKKSDKQLNLIPS